jgi:hypothetical protein
MHDAPSVRFKMNTRVVERLSCLNHRVPIDPPHEWTVRTRNKGLQPRWLRWICRVQIRPQVVERKERQIHRKVGAHLPCSLEVPSPRIRTAERIKRTNGCGGVDTTACGGGCVKGCGDGCGRGRGRVCWRGRVRGGSGRRLVRHPGPALIGHRATVNHHHLWKIDGVGGGDISGHRGQRWVRRWRRWREQRQGRRRGRCSR